MATLAQPSTPSTYFDFRTALNKNRLKGLWSMMTDFRLSYLGAVVTLPFQRQQKQLPSCFYAISWTTS